MDWELAILVIAMVAEAAIIFLMIRGRVFRSFPVFGFYICWSLFCDAFLYYIRVAHPASFFRIYLVQLPLDAVLMFALLIEVAWSVLRPIRKSLPKHSWIGIAVLIIVCALLLWPVAGLVAPPHLSHLGKTLFKLQQTPAIVRVVFFLALAGFSQVLSIGWRDRELQIATGLGFYSIVSLAVTLAHTHEAINQAQGAVLYTWLDRAAGVSYFAALVYWVFAFAAKPAERRQFTPQMQSMLLAVAGAARSTRAGLSGSGAEKPSQ